ncbi:D-ribose transporter ATP binding protein [Limnochorda pilosa]|uniref:D-ribose transporter ATP binding protein n=1 Tax=Limnochorda pilosa TaxID=1555112 RepID=A0A0K2SLS7_LIMPI|nr:D-ribose transporter ATP binding protein [Limnochorda pilosa]
MRGMGKVFPGVVALDGVDLDLYPGEVHALVGENGAGKSTLMKVLSGIYRPDAGQVLWDGAPVVAHSPGEARRLGLSIVHQEFNLVGPLSVAENLFLTDLPSSGGLLRVGEMRKRARDLLARLDLALDVTRPVESLSVAEMQLVEIARALASDCRVLILDEPTAALTRAEVERLFDVLRGLRSRGVALVYISHKLEEVFALADRVTVLRDGRQVGSGPAASWTREEVIARMVGRELSGYFPARQRQPGPPLLEVRDLSVPGKLFDVSLTLRQGEILGVFGLMGAGQELLARALFGAVPGTQGQILLDGRPVRLASPAAAISHHLALVTEDRKQEGLVLIDDVVGNTTLAALRRFSPGGFLQRRRQREVTGRFVERLRIRTPSLSQEVGHLSGGNQQKVVLAKWLATEPRVLILVEPTRGIDVGAKAEIYQIMNELAAQGRALLFVSPELPEILGLSDRILVMAEGRIRAELDPARTSQEEIMALATGVGVAAHGGPGSGAPAGGGRP